MIRGWPVGINARLNGSVDVPAKSFRTVLVTLGMHSTAHKDWSSLTSSRAARLGVALPVLGVLLTRLGGGVTVAERSQSSEGNSESGGESLPKRELKTPRA